MEGLQLRDSFEELLNFTLASSIDGALEFDLGLSEDYCSHLLQDDPTSPTHPNSTSTLDVVEIIEGVPPYPLYKHLASVLHHIVNSGAIQKRNNNMKWLQDDVSLKQIEAWNGVVLKKGSEIADIFRAIGFELHVQEPFFSQLKDGRKVVEGRCAYGDHNRIARGDTILFNKVMVHKVQDIHWYPSFHQMLEAEGLARVLPGVEDIKEGVQIYRKFYTEEQEKCNGVIAICLAKPAAQPCISMAKLLCEIGYSGIQRLLGLANTVGTVSEGLPPPRSALLSSFMLQHNPLVKSTVLTEGARALAKHVSRSSSGWWGHFDGNDGDKNRVAQDVIIRLVDNCCWLNVFIVPPHGAVFEIRVADGYGARWSKDGKKFIGFLEPYMEDGQSKR